MKHLLPGRVEHAINSIQQWYTSTQPQAAKHIIPLLALLEAGAGEMKEVRLEETDKDDHPYNDYDFWDRYLRIHDDSGKPYFNPLTLKRGNKTYPHSNAATIRKRTFVASWHAVNLREDGENSFWTLVEDYAGIFRTKALTKGGVLHRIPVLDLAVLLFRAVDFADNANAPTLLEMFRDRFKQRDADFSLIFEFKDEPAENLFTAGAIEVPGAYDTVILAALIPDEADPDEQEPVDPVTKLEDSEDHILIQVQQLLRMGTSGIIFNGPPGTGKTYYAKRVAASLVEDYDKDVFRAQFHPSFGYEDFIEGYRPDESKKSGFAIVNKLFLLACERARKVKNYVVFIIDEINRGDPARVFGELLTYVEHDYREEEFNLPFSGRLASIPKNILLLGTMNPKDRSVSHIDAAFIRRFDHIEVEPSPEVVRALVKGGSFTEAQIELIATWFENVQTMLPIGLGHSFFKNVKGVDRLKLVWRYRIKPTADTILEYDPAMRADFKRSFDALVARLEGTAPDA